MRVLRQKQGIENNLTVNGATVFAAVVDKRSHLEQTQLEAAAKEILE